MHVLGALRMRLFGSAAPCLGHSAAFLTKWAGVEPSNIRGGRDHQPTCGLEVGISLQVAQNSYQASKRQDEGLDRRLRL